MKDLGEDNSDEKVIEVFKDEMLLSKLWIDHFPLIIKMSNPQINNYLTWI